MINLNKSEVQKDLLKTKVLAKISHYKSGRLYYTIDVLGSKYQFPIDLMEGINLNIDDHQIKNINLTKLSSDIGDTVLEDNLKGSYLFRWISKAIDSEDFIKISL